MTSSFGSRLRLQRERQQVTLAAIAEATKIRLPLLEALERDDVKHWPSGIFRRSYFRTYARAIGLDPEAAVREFLELYPDPSEQADEVHAAAEAVAGSDAASRRPRTRLQYLFDSAIGALPRFGAHADQKQSPAAERPRSRSDVPAMRLTSVDDAPHAVPTIVDHLAEAHDIASDIPEMPVDFPEVPLNEHGFPAIPEAEEYLLPLQDLEAVRTPAGLPTPAAAAEADVAADAPDEIVSFGADLAGLAHLCTRIARTRELGEVVPLMGDASRVLHAVGVILWMWDSNTRVLWPACSHGYRPELLARMPNVPPDADNAIAAAFRSAETRVVDSGDAPTGAVVVPLITASGCAGVLALELRDGGERHESVHAIATILAAQLAALSGEPSEIKGEREERR